MKFKKVDIGQKFTLRGKVYTRTSLILENGKYVNAVNGVRVRVYPDEEVELVNG